MEIFRKMWEDKIGGGICVLYFVWNIGRKRFFRVFYVNMEDGVGVGEIILYRY